MLAYVQISNRKIYLRMYEWLPICISLQSYLEYLEYIWSAEAGKIYMYPTTTNATPRVSYEDFLLSIVPLFAFISRGVIVLDSVVIILIIRTRIKHLIMLTFLVIIDLFLFNTCANKQFIKMNYYPFRKRSNTHKYSIFVSMMVNFYR